MKAPYQAVLPSPAQPSFSPRVARKIPPVADEALRSPGQPLDPATRAFMEPRFAHNFGNVRVHNDTKSAESARAVNAQAYTVGQQIVFGANQFAPMSYQGRELLAHELAHTVQQRSPAADPPSVHSNGILESSASAAARAVGKGQAVSFHLPASGICLSRQPVGATEDIERARLAAEAEAALARSGQLERKWEKQEAEESQEKAARQRKLFPPILSSLEGMPLLSDEEIPDEKKRRENEEKAKKARREQELEESHDRLLLLGGMLAKGATFNKTKLMALITKDSLLDLQLLTRYGLELPGSFWEVELQKAVELPGSFKKKEFTQKEFQKEVQKAIEKFDNAWTKAHGTAATSVSALTDEDVKAMQAEQQRKENEAAQAEGLQHVEGSLAGALGAAVTDIFTDDPKKITAGAKIGTGVSGTAGSIAAAKAVQIQERAARESTEKDVPPAAAERAPKPQSEPTPTPDQPPPSSAAAPPVADVPVPYAPGGPLEKTQPPVAFEKTEPGGAPQPGPPTQSSIPPGSPGGGGGGGRRRRQTIPGNPPPMPRRPPPPRPVISWFPRRDGVAVSPEDVLRILGIDHTRVIWSFNKGNNMNEYSLVGGKGLPPLAYTSGGYVRVDHDRWIEMGYPEHR